MQFLGALTFSTVGASMTIYYNKNLGAGITGLLLMLSSVMVFAVGLWAGHLSDRFGRRPLMLFATIVTSLGAGTAALANSPIFFNPWLTYLGFLVLNFGYGFFNTASQAMLIDLTTPDNRKLVYSIQYWVLNMAILFGAALSGWFFKQFLFELLVAITLEEILSFLIVFFFIPESFDPKTSEHKQETNIFKAYLLVAKDRTFMYYCFASIFIAVIFGQLDYYLPVHLSDSFISTRLFGIEIYGQRMLTLFLMINTLIIVLGMNLMNRLTKHWSRSLGIGLGVILQGTGFVIAFLVRDLTGTVIASVVSTVGEMILVPFSQALRADLMDGDSVGTYTGAFSVTQPIAAVIGSLGVSASVFLGNVGMAVVLIFVIILAFLPAQVAIARHERKGTL